MDIVHMPDLKRCLLITVPTGKIYATERYFGHISHPTQNALKEVQI
jgi:hypothetical protein